MDSDYRKDIVNLFRCRSVVIDMLKIRGYDTANLENYTMDTIREAFSDDSEEVIGNPLNIFVENTKKDKRCMVLFVIHKKFKKQIARELVEYLIDDEMNDKPLRVGKDELIFISMNRVKDSAIQAIVNIYNEYNLHSQVFYIERLLFNPLNHILVPKFRILEKNEIEEIRKKLNIKHLTQLPLIKTTDSAGKFFGIRIGDVVHVQNKSPNGGEESYYRYCDA
jgi:DNA-directed RNA polymerase subunit H (RpoH/RPB5)